MAPSEKEDKDKEKNSTKDRFAELDSDLGETDEFGVAKPPHKRRSSVPGLPSALPKLPARLLKSFSNDGDKQSDGGKDKENVSAWSRCTTSLPGPRTS